MTPLEYLQTMTAKTKPPRCKDISGRRSGRLVAISYAGKNGIHAAWRCRCDCGIEKVIVGYAITRKQIRSCGCLVFDAIQASVVTHGMARHGREAPEYAIWRSMRVRCHKESSPHFKNYGARGITVCDRWRRSFEDFYADIGPRPSPKHSLDRIDNYSGYSPDNCRWATADQQVNNRRVTVFVEINGERLAAAHAARKYNIKYQTLKTRLRRGLSPREALGLSTHGEN